jgi:hypothetical protein
MTTNVSIGKRLTVYSGGKSGVGPDTGVGVVGAGARVAGAGVLGALSEVGGMSK